MPLGGSRGGGSTSRIGGSGAAPSAFRAGGGCRSFAAQPITARQQQPFSAANLASPAPFGNHGSENQKKITPTPSEQAAAAAQLLAPNNAPQQREVLSSSAACAAAAYVRAQAPHHHLGSYAPAWHGGHRSTSSNTIGAGAALVASTTTDLRHLNLQQQQQQQPRQAAAFGGGAAAAAAPPSPPRPASSRPATAGYTATDQEAAAAFAASAVAAANAATGKSANGSGSPPRPPSEATRSYSRQVGKGAFATVRLEHAEDGSPIAIKVYEHKVEAGAHRDERQKMQELHMANEVRLVGKLSHAHLICPTAVKMGVTTTELTMEYAPHGTLEAYVKTKGPRGVTEFDGRRLFYQILSGLSYLHSVRVVHRDLKLDNVVLDDRWNARLIDFGAAQQVGRGERLSVLQGTPGYMAPEVLTVASTKTGDVDALAADVWSAGVALFCLFNTAEIPFSGKDISELIQNVRTQPTPMLGHVSKGCADLIGRLLTKSPHARPTAPLAIAHEWVATAAKAKNLLQPPPQQQQQQQAPPRSPAKSFNPPQAMPARPMSAAYRSSSGLQQQQQQMPPQRPREAWSTQPTAVGTAPPRAAGAAPPRAARAGPSEFCASMSCRTSLFP